MSRFSTIDAQHHASRELERQRLEKKMSQLRREVEGGGGTTAPPRPSERRFQPPRQRAAAPRRASEAQPAPEGAERGPSIEMAWLLRASGRMEQEAGEVEAFLVRHELDRYTALLINNEDGLGSSLEALQLADDADLARAGLPEPDRVRLLRALQAAAKGPGQSAPHRSSSSTLHVAADLDEGPTASGMRSSTHSSACSTPRWRCLGQAPPGWHRTEIGEDGRRGPTGSRARRVVLADAATGEAEAMPEALEPAPELREAPPAAPEPAPSPGGGSRPSTAGTASGGRGAGAGKAICYQCFKQVYLPGAAEACSGAAARRFCSEACESRFNQVSAEQDERRRELGELRGQLLQGPSSPPDEASSAVD